MIVFFARVSKEKGVEDFIEAIRIAKENKHDIKAKIIGRCDNIYKNELVDLINKNGLKDNIEFVGYIRQLSKLHEEVLKSRVTVLPTYNDILPGTIIESLRLEIPVIAYAANGVTDFNKNEEVIKLVEIGNIEKLSQTILDLLSNKAKRERLIVNGRKAVEEEFNNAKEIGKLITSYKIIIDDYQNDQKQVQINKPVDNKLYAK